MTDSSTQRESDGAKEPTAIGDQSEIPSGIQLEDNANARDDPSLANPQGQPGAGTDVVNDATQPTDTRTY